MLLGALAFLVLAGLAWAVWLTSGVLLLMVEIRRRTWLRSFDDNPRAGSTVRLRFAEHGIHSENELHSSDLNWEFYKEYLERPDSWLLYYSKQHFSVIPRATLDADQTGRLSALFARKLRRLR